ncbi:hypothetical protein OROGR_010759 [Orobanche gracilis]
MKGKRSPPSKPQSTEQETENLESPDGTNCEKQEEYHSQPHKKQVRRRVQTRKPYQEKLLNMAEARREIVTALKLHRARRKQQPQPEVSSNRPESRPSSSEHEARLKSRRNPRIYASNSSTACNESKYLPSDHCRNSIGYPTGLYYPYCPRPVSSFAPPLFLQENLNFVLPTQTLGLNLNLRDFNNLEITRFRSATDSSLMLDASSSTSASCSPAPSVSVDEIPMNTVAAEIRSSEDQNQIGWGGGLGFEISDVRAEFLESMEIGPDEKLKGEGFVSSPFDGVMEFPAWVIADESCLQHVSGFCGGGCCFQDHALPW